jgi:hypothetical protein
MTGTTHHFKPRILNNTVKVSLHHWMIEHMKGNGSAYDAQIWIEIYEFLYGWGHLKPEYRSPFFTEKLFLF